MANTKYNRIIATVKREWKKAEETYRQQREKILQEAIQQIASSCAVSWIETYRKGIECLSHLPYSLSDSFGLPTEKTFLLAGQILSVFDEFKLRLYDSEREDGEVSVTLIKEEEYSHTAPARWKIGFGVTWGELSFDIEVYEDSICIEYLGDYGGKQCTHYSNMERAMRTLREMLQKQSDQIKKPLVQSQVSAPS